MSNGTVLVVYDRRQEGWATEIHPTAAYQAANRPVRFDCHFGMYDTKFEAMQSAEVIAGQHGMKVKVAA